MHRAARTAGLPIWAKRGFAAALLALARRVRGRCVFMREVVARPERPSRWTLPITALRVTLPRRPAIWLALKPSPQSFFKSSTRSSVHDILCSLPVEPHVRRNTPRCPQDGQNSSPEARKNARSRDDNPSRGVTQNSMETQIQRAGQLRGRPIQAVQGTDGPTQTWETRWPRGRHISWSDGHKLQHAELGLQAEHHNLEAIDTAEWRNRHRTIRRCEAQPALRAERTSFQRGKQMLRDRRLHRGIEAAKA